MSALAKVRAYLFPAVRPRTALDVRYEKAFLLMKPSLLEFIYSMARQMPTELAVITFARVERAASCDDLERIYVECTFILEAQDRLWSGEAHSDSELLNDAMRLMEAARSTVVSR